MPVILIGNGANRSTVPVSAFDSMVVGLHQLLDAFDGFEKNIWCDGEQVAVAPKHPERYDEIRVKLDSRSPSDARALADELFDSHGWRGDPPFAYTLIQTNNELELLHGTDG